MRSTPFAAAASSRFARLLAACIVAASLTGCLSAKHYVDPAYAGVKMASVKPPAAPKPVQVVFEFKNKAGTNATVTEMLRPKVVAVLTESRCFSEVATGGTSADNALFITMTNVPVTENAAAQGFGTGLTFGLVGTMVTDGYTLDVTWKAGSKAAVKKSYKHAMHSTIGNKDGPPGLTAVPAQEAVNTILEQMLTSLLIDLSADKDPASL